MRYPRFLNLIRLLSFTFLLVSPLLAASPDEPFTYPSNWGATGLMEIPTARVMKENAYRFGASQIDPYRYYYGTLGLLPGLEVGGRITEVIGVRDLSSSYGNYKDKAIDMKYRFLPETKYLPALAVGIMDPQGTRLYAGQYVVASKQIYPFDFTVGFGNGRFGNRPLQSSSETFKAEIFTEPHNWARDAQLFWGIQFAPSNRFALMMEYSPIKYEVQTQDPAQPRYFKRPAPLPYNFGLRLKPFSWGEVDVTYQRGNQIGVSLSVAFDIGNPLIPIRDKHYREKSNDRTLPLEKRIAKALNSVGFSNISSRDDGSALWIEAENNRYFYATRAAGVALRTVSPLLPPHLQRIHLILADNGIPRAEFNVDRNDLRDFYMEKLTVDELFALSDIRTDGTRSLGASAEYKKAYSYGIRPVAQTFLNDPSGFFQYRVGVEGWLAYHPWKGSSLVLGLEGYPINNISTSNQPLSIPVRSDIASYKEQNVELGKLMFEQIAKLPHQTYGRLAAGYLEIEYAGLDGEMALSLRDGRVLLGLGSSLVKKRAPKEIFGLKNDDARSYYYTGFLNARLNAPEKELALDVKAGRFLAGDLGARVTVSKFIKGVTLYAWYGFTDTSVFKDSFNRGYHDKGIGIRIPLRLFEGADSRTVFNYSLSPWTRDVAQDIDHHTTLFDYMGRNEKIYLDKDRKLFP